jgi:hypothetical protein
MADFRIGRTAKTQALAELERVGLIRVKRQSGRTTLVFLSRGLRLVASDVKPDQEDADADSEFWR